MTSATAPAAPLDATIARTNTRINRAATVHRAWLYAEGGIIGTLCGSDGRQGRRPYYRPTTDDVTCKKCSSYA